MSPFLQFTNTYPKFLLRPTGRPWKIAFLEKKGFQRDFSIKTLISTDPFRRGFPCRKGPAFWRENKASDPFRGLMGVTFSGRSGSSETCVAFHRVYFQFSHRCPLCR